MPLTEREQAQFLDQVRKGQKRSSPQTREAFISILEKSAALLADGCAQGIPRDWLLSKLSKHFKFPANRGEKTQKLVVGDGDATRSVSLARGVELRLGWDWSLVEVNVDTEEFTRRRMALGLIGIGKDERDDVSERHDEYL